MIYEWHVLVVSPRCRLCLFTQRSLVGRRGYVTRQKRLRGTTCIMGVLCKYHWFILSFSLCVRVLQKIISKAPRTYNCWRFTRPLNAFSCKLFSLLLKRYLQRKVFPWINSSRVDEQVCSAVVNALVFHQSKWPALSYVIPNFVI